MYVWRKTWYLWTMRTAGLDVYEQIKTTGLVLVSDSMASCRVLYGKFDAVASSFTNWTQKTFDAKNCKLKCLSAFEAASNGKTDAKMAPNSSPAAC